MAAAPVVDTSRGRLVGRRRRGVELYAGIPYAVPPVGERRWLPPVAHPGWEGDLDATEFGPIAPQLAGTVEMITGDTDRPPSDESCLTLNVVTPAADGGARPVMVWIHGGGFTTGAGSIPWYDGSRLAASGDVVVVTVNYRLGVLGFLELGHVDPALASSGSLGLQDQVAALEWVRDEVAAFGGDPARVTVFGESAGAMSVATLMTMPSAAGLFDRAIAQSGAAHHTQAPERARELTDALVAELGCGDDLDALQAVEVSRLLDVQGSVGAELTRARASRPGEGGLGLAFLPVVDGEVLPRAPIEAMRDGTGADIELVTGTNRDEWNLFDLASSPVDDEGTLFRRLERITADPDELVGVYRQRLGGDDHHGVWRAAMTDQVFRIPAIRMAEARAAHGATTRMYAFDWASSAFGGRLGSCHALEIPFAFDVLDAPGVDVFTGPDAPRPLASAMSRAWTAFAHAGDPSHDGIGEWPVHDTDRHPTMHLDVTCEVRDDPAAAERVAWAALL